VKEHKKALKRSLLKNPTAEGADILSILESNSHWTEEAHSRFVGALREHGANYDYEKLAEAVGTKSREQVKSHL